MIPLLVCSECRKRPETCDCPKSLRQKPLVDLWALLRRDAELAGQTAGAA